MNLTRSTTARIAWTTLMAWLAVSTVLWILRGPQLLSVVLFSTSCVVLWSAGARYAAQRRPAGTNPSDWAIYALAGILAVAIIQAGGYWIEGALTGVSVRLLASGARFPGAEFAFWIWLYAFVVFAAHRTRGNHGTDAASDRAAPGPATSEGIAGSSAGSGGQLFAESRGRVVPLRLEEIEHLEAQGDYVRVWRGREPHLIRGALSRLTKDLGSPRFVQVHRSHVINLDRVTAFEKTDDGRITIALETGKTVLSSRSRTPELRAVMRNG